MKWYFPCVDEAQRLRGIVLESLDQEQDANGLARHAYRSRTQFYRVFRAMIEETPVAMRRRLLLERAAWQLSRTQLSVTDISLNANYGSLEAFTRAFRKAFRRFTEPLSPYGGDIHSPARNERNSSPFR